MPNDVKITMDVIKTEEMKRYDRNMKILQKVYPEYHKMIDDCVINQDYILTRTGEKQEFNVFDTKRNQFLYDIEQPVAKSKEALEALNIKNGRVIVYLGHGLGYSLLHFTQLYASRQSTQGMIVIERDIALFKLSLFCIDFGSMIRNGALLLILGDQNDNLLSLFETYIRAHAPILYSLKTLKVVYETKVFQLNKPYYLASLKELNKVIQYTINYYGNDPEDSLIGLENILGNIKEIIESPGVNLLFDKFPKKPAIIVATGPSLNKNKALLKGLEDKALIICPDASLKILLEMDVKPHLVTALERVPLTATLVEGLPADKLEGVYYAATPVVPNEAYQAYQGKYLMVYRNFNHFKWLGIERGTLDIKQSSGNMAYKIADALGCDPIILIGQDLAYGEDGYTHASGATLGDKQNVQKGSIEVKGNLGGTVLTNPVWNTFRHGYEIDVHQSKAKTINATEGGAYINGTEVMPFEEAIALYIQDAFDPREKIDDYLSVFSTGNIHKDLERIKKTFKDTESDLQEMMDSCYKGVKFIQDNKEELLAYQNGECKVAYKLDKMHETILKIKKEVFAKEPTMSMFMMHIVQSVYISFEIGIYALPDEIEDELAQKSTAVLKHEKFFGYVYKMIEVSRESLLNAMAKTEEMEF